MNLDRLLLAAFFIWSTALYGQSVNSDMLLKPPADSWPMFNGDYSGQRFSSLKQINSSNIKNLQLQWIYRLTKSSDIPGFGDGLKSTPILAHGVIYTSLPDNVWAVDAYTGREIWHYRYPPTDSIASGHRGVAISGDSIYFESRDCHVVSLDANSGKLRWSVEIADGKLGYFCTAPPLVVGNHLIVGVGGDSQDIPGYLEARDLQTGKLQWHWDTEPKPGEPGSETWPDIEAMTHGGGMTWIPGTYDPELNLLFWGIGNPNPVHAGAGRKGANLWTDCIVALNADTGKLVWYFQTTPHDTHDWDAVQTPIIIDGEFDGKPRKMVAQANRNGFFFLLDRTNGQNLLTKPFVETNWTSGVDSRGTPISDPKKDPTRDGTIVSPPSGGASNYFPPSFNPQTGLFYVNALQSWSIYYLTGEGKAQGFAGRDEALTEGTGMLLAIDYQTGKIRWSHDLYGSFGISAMNTAGKLLFTGDESGHFMALNPATGDTLWHTTLVGKLRNSITYELDGRQYVLATAGDSLYAFALPRD